MALLSPSCHFWVRAATTLQHYIVANFVVASRDCFVEICRCPLVALAPIFSCTAVGQVVSIAAVASSIVHYIARCVYISRLILLPNRAYSSTLSCCISSFVVPILSSSSETSSSIRDVDEESISCAFSRGKWKKVSPILYLYVDKQMRPSVVPEQEQTNKDSRSAGHGTHGTNSSSSASSSSIVTSSSSSFSFYAFERSVSLWSCS